MGPFIITGVGNAVILSGDAFFGNSPRGATYF